MKEDNVETREALRAEAWRALYEAGDAIRQRIFVTAQSKDLSPAQVHLLVRLEHSTPIAMSQAAQLLGCDASNVTGLTDRLEKRGLIERQTSTTDRRVKMLALTPSGVEMRRELAETFASMPSILGELDVDELRTLRDLMRRLAASSAPSANRDAEPAEGANGGPARGAEPQGAVD